MGKITSNSSLLSRKEKSVSCDIDITALPGPRLPGNKACAAGSHKDYFFRRE